MLALTLNTVKNLHEVVIKHGGERGIKSEGSLIACLDRPFTNFYGDNPYPTIFDKAYALLYSMAGPFHPFTDGNKRTALLVTSYFLRVNGYEFNYPEDSYEFIKSIARNKIKSKKKISKWIEKACMKNQYYGYDDESRMSELNATRVNIYGNER